MKLTFSAQNPGSHLFPLSPLTDRPVAGGRYSRNADVFGRIFQFVRVPCPFACASVAIAPWSGLDDLPPDDPLSHFRPPFNQIPMYREPGGVNLNTIPPGEIGNRIWDALRGTVPTNNSESPAPTFESLAQSRTLPLGPERSLDLPFREMRGIRHDLTSGAAAANAFIPEGLITRGELLELDGQLAPRNATLFGDMLAAPGEAPLPLFASALAPPPGPGIEARDPRVHPWFALQPLIRSAANSTVRSETYAIWVTMGLFEVRESPEYIWYDLPNAALVNVGPGETSWNYLYPDGLQLVREYGR